MKKTVKKTTKKTIKPEFIMNCVTNTTPDELYTEAVNAKVRAGKAITKDELEYIKEKTISDTVDKVAEIAAVACFNAPCKTFEVKDGEKLVFDAYGNAKVKKPNMFRRFWNWLRRK